MHPENKFAMAFVSGINSRWCPNLRAEHSNARIWFYIVQSGMEVRCNCKCKTIENRISGKTCKDFRTLKMPMDYATINALFPNNMFRKRKVNSMPNNRSFSVPTTPPTVDCAAKSNATKSTSTEPGTPRTESGSYLEHVPMFMRRPSDSEKNSEDSCAELHNSLTAHLKRIQSNQDKKITMPTKSNYKQPTNKKAKCQGKRLQNLPSVAY